MAELLTTGYLHRVRSLIAFALVLAACMMLEYMNDDERARRIRHALESTIREKKTVTRDLGGSASTDQFTDAVIAKL